VGTGFGEAAEGWVQLGEWWLDAWSKHITKVATHVDSGAYTAAEATKDLVDCAVLAGETLLLIGNEVVDAAAVITQHEPEPLETPPFATDKVTNLRRTLVLDGPLTSSLVADQIPTSAVKLVPEELKPNETAFLLRVRRTGFAGVGYLGSVGVFEKGTPRRVDTVIVWVQVP